MSDLRDLYQEVIIDHNRQPRNFGKLAAVNHQAEGFNPLCGDHVHVYLLIEQDKIKEIAFEGKGCAISTASASIMTEVIKGKSLAEALHCFNAFHDLVTGKSSTITQLGKLTALAGVQEFPARVKCATLAWHTLQAAVQDKTQPVSTE